MSESRYIDYNGEHIHSEEPVLLCDNRAFLYGDALFETMICFDGRIPFIREHISRLKQSMEILKMRIPFQFNEEFFNDQVGRLLKRNKFYKGVRVRLTVFRKEGGLYTPLTNEVSYLIDITPINFDRFSINNKGLVIDVYKDHLKPINTFSSIKSTNALLFTMAGLYKKQNKLDECIILNQNKHICETISSNIFLAKNNKLFTPSLESGCLRGVMRKIIIELATDNRINVDEVPNLTVDHLTETDECFITNAINGVRWVSGFKNGRFFNKMSGFLINELNKRVGYNE